VKLGDENTAGLARAGAAPYMPKPTLKRGISASKNGEPLSMTVGYVFEAGAQKAITNKADASNLSSPKIGTWTPVKTVDDVNKPGLIGFDPELFAKQGYQIWPAPKDFRIGESAIGGPDTI
jgi:hypothetical protein